MTPATSHAETTGEGKSSSIPSGLRKDWTVAEALALYALPFNDLLFKAQTKHRAHFDPNRVQLSRLLISRPADARRIAAIAASPRITRPALPPRS